MIAEAVGPVTEDGNELPRDVDVVEQPDGGANALNVNRCGSTLFLPTFAETQDLLSLTVSTTVQVVVLSVGSELELYCIRI